MISDALEKLEEAALEALARKCLRNLSPDAFISDEEVMRQLGITPEDIGNAEQPGMRPFSIVWTKEALEDFSELAPSVRPQTQKRNCSSRGKSAFGNCGGTDLSGLF